MEVYVDDMLVKSRTQEQFIADLRKIFDVLRSSRMRLNPKKCTFGVRSEKFLGYMIFKKRVKANPDKINAIMDMAPPQNIKEVQRLAGRMALLWPFQPQLLLWPGRGTEADQAKETVETGMAKESAKVAHAKRAAEARRSGETAKATQTREAFEALQAEKSVKVAQINEAAKTEQTGEASQTQQVGETAKITQAKGAVKAEQARGTVQAKKAEEAAGRTDPVWTLYVDGASSKEGCGARLLIISPTGEELAYALRFDFRTFNNEFEYETLIAGMEMTRKLRTESIKVYSDSQLIVNQIWGNYEVKEEPLRKYVTKAHELRGQFKQFMLKQIPRSQNKRADALSKLASTSFGTLNREVLVEVVEGRTYEQLDTAVIQIVSLWMDPIVRYLTNG
ncbi:uncharacterized protein [Coffea arabica]|uniref:Reverse transcriptase domain-containing protein n=1 Tax=Coffea arabica TaxID=13443 RepID=A0ABM4UEV5_COFAR